MVRIDRIIGGKWGDDEDILWWSGRWWRAGELFELAGRMESSLKEGGFSPGQRLAVLMPNCPSLLALSLACWRLGGSVAPLNPASGPDALVAALRFGDPASVVLGGPLVEKLSPLLDSSGLPWSSTSMDGPMENYRGRVCSPSGEDIALLFATSGTTGRPKAVPLTHDNVFSDVQQSLDLVSEIREDDVFLNVLPNFHTLGFIVSGILPLLSGMSQAIMPSFMPPDRVLDCIDETKASVLVGVPTMLRFMVGAASKSNRRFSSVRVIISGGDRFPPDLDRRVQDVFGVPVLEGYGLTECSPVLAVNPDYRSRKLGTVGPMLSQIEWELRDQDGERLEKNSEGILWVKGPSVVREYFGDRESSAEKFDSDGWFDTGDVVSVDDDGYVRIMDRASDVIIVGGFNVYPQEVENVIMSLNGIREAAVVGAENSMTGQVPCAYVIAEEGVSSGDVVGHCKQNLAHYKVPRRVEFVEELPKNSLGKVLRRVLRDGLRGEIKP
ncbi:MAG: AMP-binding protein [Dethiosulfovibrio sp.]|nr:AMP-binding protein [Dethiosulfovibrio sp.]